MRRLPTVVFVGVPEASVVLDDVLPSGDYDLLLVTAPDIAYPEILRTIPDYVVICLEADDEVSLQLLSMLGLDSRTRHVEVITWVGPAGDAGVEVVDAAIGHALIPARKSVVLH